MGMVDGAGHHRYHLRRTSVRQPLLDAPDGKGAALLRLGQARAFDQLHAEEVLAFVFADLVDGHDIRMVEVGSSLGLSIKTPHVRGRSQLTSQDHLESDDAVQAYLPGLVDHAHAAAGDFFQQFIIAEIANARQPIRARRFLGADRGVAGMSLLQRLRHALHRRLVREKLAQFLGEVGMPAQQLRAVGVLSRIDRLQVTVQDRFQLLFARWFAHQSSRSVKQTAWPTDLGGPVRACPLFPGMNASLAVRRQPLISAARGELLPRLPRPASRLHPDQG